MSKPVKRKPLPGEPKRKAVVKKAAVKKAAVKKAAVKKAVVKKAAVKKAAAKHKAATRKAVAKLAGGGKAGGKAGDLSPEMRRGATAAVLDRLFETVTARRDADPNLSHSARLLSRGRLKVAQKFGEEAVECLIEAVAGNGEKLIGESADMLYHLIVMWVDAGLHPEAVWSELRRREGVSGIAEKASRVTRELPGQ